MRVGNRVKRGGVGGVFGADHVRQRRHSHTKEAMGTSSMEAPARSSVGEGLPAPGLGQLGRLSHRLKTANTSNGEKIGFWAPCRAVLGKGGEEDRYSL